jgi:hypothetical protein
MLPISAVVVVEAVGNGFLPIVKGEVLLHATISRSFLFSGGATDETVE